MPAFRLPAWLRRHQPDPRWRPEFDTLARYNAETARGVQHAPEWRACMAELQRQFNDAYRPATTTGGV